MSDAHMMSGEPTKTTSPVEQWWQAIRLQTYRNLPLESALSFPVPVLQGGELLLAAFYYGVQRGTTPGGGLARPPLARLLATYPGARLLYFITRSVQKELFPGLPAQGTLGPLVAQPTTVNDRMKERGWLFEYYPKILAGYQNRAGDVVLLRQFDELFRRQVAPGLLPYYQALNPDFFEWLKSY